MDNLINKIQETTIKEERTNLRITRALKFLELKAYRQAKEAAELALSESEFIEQRLTILHLLLIAEKEDDKYTEEQLSIAYDIK